MSHRVGRTNTLGNEAGKGGWGGGGPLEIFGGVCGSVLQSLTKICNYEVSFSNRSLESIYLFSDFQTKVYTHFQTETVQ